MGLLLPSPPALPPGVGAAVPQGRGGGGAKQGGGASGGERSTQVLPGASHCRQGWGLLP